MKNFINWIVKGTVGTLWLWLISSLITCPFYTQNKSSDNPIASLNLCVHNFSSSEKCRPPNLSGKAGNALIPFNSLLLSHRVISYKALFTVHIFFQESKVVSTLISMFLLRWAAVTLTGSTSSPSGKSISLTSAETSTRPLNISRRYRWVC